MPPHNPLALLRARTPLRQRTASASSHLGWRPVTILAPGPNADGSLVVESPSAGSGTQDTARGAGSEGPSSETGQGATIDAAPAPPGAAGSANGSSSSNSTSQHPYANFKAIPLPDGSPSDVGVTVSSTPSAPDPPPTPHRPARLHPFDTHAFVLHMERSEFSHGVSRSLMAATRQLINERTERAMRTLLHKEDVENAAYLFKAALSELRTELSVRARNEGLTLRSTTSLIRREVDALSQKLKEDIGTLKHDIEMDMNNRKSETRSDQKNYDISIEEINNKFTISLGDLRTEIEQAKWDATRRAIAIIAGVVFVVISVTTLTEPTKALPPPPPAAPSTVTMREIGVGDARLDDEDDALLDMRLSGLREELGRVQGGGGGGRMVDAGGQTYTGA